VALGTYTWPVNITVPAGTSASAPFMVTPLIGSIMVASVEVRIPRGHNGLTGLSINDSGTQILPYSNTTEWITGSDERLQFDLGQETDTGLQLVGYNLDVFAHTFYVRIIGQYMVVSNPADLADEQIVPIS